jgi:hypothetical protein
MKNLLLILGISFIIFIGNLPLAYFIVSSSKASQPANECIHNWKKSSSIKMKRYYPNNPYNSEETFYVEYCNYCGVIRLPQDQRF